jgi:hypothetical protein
MAELVSAKAVTLPGGRRARLRAYDDGYVRLVSAVFRLAPPARFELALPPPEGGALSPELRGPRQSTGPLPGEGPKGNVPAQPRPPIRLLPLGHHADVRELIRNPAHGQVWHSFAM